MSGDGNSRMLPPEGGDFPSPSKHRTSRMRIKIIGPRGSRQLIRETSLRSPSESQLELAMSEDGNSRILPSESGDVPSPSEHGTSARGYVILGPLESRGLGFREVAILPESQMELAMCEDGKYRLRRSKGGDVPSPSKHGTSRKRIRMDEPMGFGRLIWTDSGVPLCLNFDGVCSKEDFAGCAEMALSSFNGTNRAEAPVYELVEELGCILSISVGARHFNFIARPKNGTEDEKKLFFAEVINGPYDGGNGRHCTCCCILGAPGSETGLGGCRLLCNSHPGHVQHPEAGFTKKVWYR